MRGTLASLAALICVAVLAVPALATGGPTITSATVVANDTVEIVYTGVTGPTVNVVVWDGNSLGTRTTYPLANTGDVQVMTDDGGYYYFQVCQPPTPCSKLVKVLIP